MHPTPPPKLDSSKSDAKSRLLGSRRAILVVLFAVTGFLGLPILWWSPVFSNREKRIWTAINVVYTMLMILGCVAICWWSFARIWTALRQSY